MSAALLSNPETKVPPPTDPHRQRATPNLWRTLKKNVAKKLAVLAAFVILVPGCADLPPPSASGIVTQTGAVEETEVIASDSSSGLSYQVARPDSVQQITEISSIAKLASPNNLSNSTGFSLTALSSALLKPSLFSVRAILDQPTPTLTATPSPTATSWPTPTLTPTATPSPTAIPLPEIKHVVIITIDGLRPDALAQADTPTLDDLIAKGAYSPNAQTVLTSITLPSHASMLSGMVPAKHGILWNTPYIGWPGMDGPTLFSVAHEAGLSTAMVFGKEKLHYMVLPNSVDKISGIDCHDPAIKEKAIEFIEEGLHDILFIHFPDTDRVGHDYGWMSTNQLYAVTFVDGMIAEVVAVLEKEGYLDSTLLIITSDHGGHGKAHGDDSPEDRTIPWLAVGPNVPSGIILNQNINTYDTAATVLHALEIPIPEKWDGQPILGIFQ